MSTSIVTGTVPDEELRVRLADWQQTIRIVTTPAVIEIPQGGYWQIHQLLCPPPIGWTPETEPAREPGAEDPWGWLVIEADHGEAALVFPDGGTQPVSKGDNPLSCATFDAWALRMAAWRLANLDKGTHVHDAGKVLAWIEGDLRERGPSVPGLEALEAALKLACIAWAQYRTDVIGLALSVLPFTVSAELRPRRITIRHRPRLYGGGGDGSAFPDLAPINVELSAFVRTQGPEVRIKRPSVR